MAMLLPLFSKLAFLCLSFSPRIYSYAQADNIRSWCSQTPYPKPCEYFLSQNPNYGPIVQRSDFIKASIKLALDRALDEFQNLHVLSKMSANKREEAAWVNCIEFYQDSIEFLNKTLDPYTNYSQFDAQTWLSSALTYLESCRDGFLDLGVSEKILPMLNYNATYQISNALAVNIMDLKFSWQPKYRKGFPTWVSPGDRKVLQDSNPKGNVVVVAQDGSGNFKTISEALAAAGTHRSGYGRYVIQVKAGTYNEIVQIGKELKNIMILGDGVGKTIITGSRSVREGYTTPQTATLTVNGDGFIGSGITVRNTAGAANGQAVAMLSTSDLSAFYQCSFEGYQDTLCPLTNRQFYKECDIYGTVDFIFGNAAVVLQNCHIYVRKPPSDVNVVTAQGRISPNQTTGTSLHHCNVTAVPDLVPVQGLIKTYLGRPWKDYSRTVFMETNLDGLIDPEGWTSREGVVPDTLYYREYMNTGAGSSTAGRVKWHGYNVITRAAEAVTFTVGRFIGGGSWLPYTNVPFSSGL